MDICPQFGFLGGAFEGSSGGSRVSQIRVPTPEKWAKTLFGNIFSENCMKMKGGGCASANGLLERETVS